MYSINVFYLLDGEEMLLVSSNVYAVDWDLHECKYYKADLHMHTTYSGGYESSDFSLRPQGNVVWILSLSPIIMLFQVLLLPGKKQPTWDSM